MKNNKLEFIRGIASLMVFFCHCESNSTALKNSKLYHYLVNWGTEAVIIFFILSGIVIHISQQKHPKSPNQFLINRFKRLYPAYIVGLALAFSLSPAGLPTILGNLLFLGTMQNYIVGIPVANTVVWTLSFEMFFYLMYFFYLKTNNSKAFMIAWAGSSLLCIPLYYLHFKGPLGQLIALLAFSSIWLLGYFTSMYREKFPKISLPQAFFAFGLLFLSARIKYTADFYCIIKYLIFAIVSLPIFIYCLQMQTEPRRPFSWIYPLTAYVLLLIAIQVSSDSLKSSKIIYSICPLVFLGISFLLTPAVKRRLLQAGVFLGFISYSLYIIHYPLEVLLSRWAGASSGLVFVFIALVTIIPAAYLLEVLTSQVFYASKKQKSTIQPTGLGRG